MTDTPQTTQSKKISGAQAMVECLRKEGITEIFGYPGATIAPFYDCLFAAHDIRHILARTEQGAGHEASGYARITGKIGVCVATSGPGATNLITAIATAYSDSIPMVAITGQVATYQLGSDVFQEVDTTGAVEPFTKYTYLVKSAADIPRVFKEAFHIASTGRKGPVLIDVPVDVQKQTIAFSYPESVNIRGYKPRSAGHVMQVQKVIRAIRAAKKPVLCCGGGVFLAQAQPEILEMCRRWNLPVVSTMMGIGVLPPNHPLYYGMVGQSGVRAANVALMQSDLLILIGARVADRAFHQPSHLETHATIVHIDIDTAEIGKNVNTTIPLVGDAKVVVSQLLEHEMDTRWPEWVETLNQQREKDDMRALSRTAKEGGIEPNAFIRALCKSLPDKSVYVADVGQNQIWSARNFSAPGRFLTTGGMGTMGYSIPAAIGAKIAAPARAVVAVCGDGSFQMTMNELATMNQHNAPIKVVLMRNGKLGMVHEIQRNSYGGRESAVDLAGSPDFALIARAYCMDFIRAHTMDEAVSAIAPMLASDKGFLLECVVSSEEGTV